MILTEVSNEDVGDLVTRRLTNESWQHIQVIDTVYPILLLSRRRDKRHYSIR